MNPSQRIGLNAGATYARSIVGVGLSLFSSRWVLSALGQTDYGLFNIVGSIIVFITFLNSVMAGSASRHFAYSIGRGDPREVGNWFNAAIGIHLCMASGLVLLGWPVGEYVIRHVLTIPLTRMPVCLLVFRVSLASAFIGMVSIPFVAMFTAKQHIAELAFWGVLHSILVFVFAWLLTGYSGDRLLCYAVGMVSFVVFIQIAQMIRVVVVFKEYRVQLRHWFDLKRFREIFSFAMWSLFGSAGAMLSTQGTAVLLNLHFGPKVNAAYGIANMVSAQTGQLSMAMVGAFSPEITASEGRGDRARMLSLSLRTSKLGTILAMLFAIPLIIEMDYVLHLWLLTPPAFTALFCQLMLITFIIDKFTSGYMTAVNAHGKIAAYQASIGTIFVLTLPLAWLFLKLGFAPTSVGVAYVMTMAVCSLGRVLWVRHLFGVPVRRWLTTVVFPSATVALAGTLAAIAPHWVMSASFYRLSLVATVSVAASLLTAWLLALDDSERRFIAHNATRLLGRIYAATT